MKKVEKLHWKRKISIFTEENLLEPLITSVNKLIFVGKFFKNDSNLLFLFLEFTFFYGKFAIFEQNLRVSIPFGKNSFKGVAESYLEFLVFFETIDEYSVVSLEEKNQN